tara:strand:+ start:2324 stop:2977 length:654 start_codon:yes stop_codon:yes gene_type:complete
MKKFKNLFETPAVDYRTKEADDDEATKYKPRSKGEEDFANMHLVTKTGHPVAFDHQFTGDVSGNERLPMGEPDKHIGGIKHADGESQPVKQGTSETQPGGSAYSEPKQYGRGGEKAPVMQGSSKIKESFKFSNLRTVLDEGVVDTLKKIKSRKQAMPVKFKNKKTLKVDMFTASALLAVHDALKPGNAKRFRDSLEKGETSFMTMVDFAMQNVGNKK